MRTITIFIAAAALSIAFKTLADVPHPLDGLTAAEYETVVTVLTDAGKIDTSSAFVLVNLAEPDKATVLAWRSGDPIERRAFVAVRHRRQLYDGIVDLTKRKLASWRIVEEGQATLLGSEWMLSQGILRKNPEWQAAIRKRGIDDIKSVFCFPVFPGYYDLPRDRDGRRLGMISCYDSGSENGLWGRPIAGLVAVVDYDEREIVELIDTGVVPIPEGGPRVDAEQPTTMPAAGPAERRFNVSGHWVDWDRWKFHLRIDPRVGPVLSRVSFSEDGADRSVMYQGSVSELFVPYMDPTTNWYYRAYLDVGEYGIGTSGVKLRRGEDCPADSEMLDAEFMNERGKVYTKEGTACIFERVTGDAGWSHFEIAKGKSASRRHTELVVRFIVWLGNYDYVLDWIFTETGSVKGRVGATGIVQIRGVNAQNMKAATAMADTAYGRLISPGTVAINHDHFFNFRLDLDVDGTQNTLSIDRLRRTTLDPKKTGTPRRQIWQIFPHEAATESEAQLNVDPQRPALWRVINPKVTNAVGNPVSYHLSPGKTGRTLMNDEEFAHRRAAFSAYNLWVTPYAPAERYAAGDYPNRHPGSAGLPEWTAADRPIKNTDVVLWYTVGMHHVVRAEDWPLMPTLHHEFELRPFDFFDYNPTVTRER